MPEMGISAKEIEKLSKSDAKRHAEGLRREIERHNYLYYVKNRPEISDEEYDRLYDTLERIEEAFPDLIKPESPTQRVGAEPREELPVMEHTAPLLSLDATREEAEVRRFAERVRKALGEGPQYILEEKYDGASVEIVYGDGVLDRAVTRGNGTRGEGVTENIKTIKPLPLRLLDGESEPPSLLAVRGEVLMKISDFQELNRRLLEAGSEPFANPRNAAAGSLRQLDPRITAERPLDVVVYEILQIEGREFSRDDEVLKALAAWGLPTPQKVVQADSVEELVKAHDRWAEERDRLDYEIDGVVIKVNDLDARRKLGATAHHPRWAMAYKFEPRREVTRIERIVVQVGRTGILTPVALMRPVEVGGVTVSRASLHNREEVGRKDVRPGDQVRIQRAGDVIPEVVERIREKGRRRGDPFKMPSKCPSCGTEVQEKGPLTVCPNRFGCPAQFKGRLHHFASKQALDIEGMGEETVSALVDRGMVQRLADLFSLGANDFLKLEGFAERSSQKLHGAIQGSKRADLARFLYALGIPEAGAAVTRDLAMHFRSLEALRRASRSDLQEVPGIGPKMSQAIRDFFQDSRIREEIDALIDAGIRIVPPERAGGGPLSGKQFVFTGSLERFSRTEAEALVESLGARATSSVSGGTDYVVAGKDPGRKLEEARERGVEILNEEEFVALLGKSGAQI